MFMAPYWASYIFSIVLLIGSTATVLLLPHQIGILFQILGGPQSGITIDAVRNCGLFIVGLLVVQALFGSAFSYISTLISERIGNDLRYRFFVSFIRKPYREESPSLSGEVASEFVSDLTIIQSGLGETLISMVRHVLFTIGALFAMFFVNVKTAIITLAGALTVAIILFLFSRSATTIVKKIQISRAEVVGKLLESINNRYVIKAYRKESYFENQFVNLLSNYYAGVKKYSFVISMVNPVGIIILSTSLVVIIYSGIEQIGSGHMAASDLVTFLIYVLILVSSIVQAGLKGANLQQSAEMCVKHSHLLIKNWAPEGGNGAANEAVGRLPHLAAVDKAASGHRQPVKFEFDEVSFRYPGASVPALKGVSFTIPAGKTTALVGESGSGKSTVAALLVGLLEPDTGHIVAHGQAGLSPGLIAIVPQEPFLFAATIDENIRFGRDDLGSSAVVDATKKAHIEQLVNSLPGGIEHFLHEGGDNLSRGQKQRIAIARALVNRPGTIIFDEATASLDKASEYAVAQSLSELHGIATILVIAHQGQLLDGIDHLVELKDGVVSYEGDPTIWLKCRQNKGDSTMALVNRSNSAKVDHA
jgi:ATP-binding cassette, subfamily B, bacterial